MNYKNKTKEQLNSELVKLNKRNAELKASENKCHQTEKELRKSREDYKILFETTPHGIQENDLSGRITFSNKAHCNMLGHDQGALVGKYIWEFHINEEEREGLRQYMKVLIKDQPPPTPYETKNITKDGKFIDVQTDWNYKRDSNGKLIGFISIITNITERKRAQQKLLTQAMIIDQIHDSVISTDLVGFVTSWNRRGRKTFWLYE